MRRGLEMMETDLAGKNPKVTLQKWTMTVVTKSKVTMMKASTHNKRKEQEAEKEFQRKNLYQVAPKFPRVEKEVEDERAGGNQIAESWSCARTSQNSTTILVSKRATSQDSYSS
jgi:hypothetical protein